MFALNFDWLLTDLLKNVENKLFLAVTYFPNLKMIFDIEC